MKNQQGVGLLEVMVALLLLAVAVLGFTALQLRAVGASIEAGNNIHAVNFARDLTERMRVNRDGLAEYKTAASTTTGYTVSTATTCEDATHCTPAQLAAYDFVQVNKKAQLAGMEMAIRQCQGMSTNRYCIYVAWDDTTPTNGSADTDCTDGTSYVAGAKCIIMESFNYE